MEARTLEPGTLVDRRYAISRFLASGGLAHVYAATHKITGRQVALKMPHGDRDAVANERLTREAQALTRAQHAGVVELVDAGEHEGAPYLALELLEGRTLGGLLAARGKLAWEEAAYVALKIADIMGHCHERGVIHRDIKPDNVFVLPSGSWNVKLFDFGIARLAGSGVSEAATKLTQEGSILGTPEYMAPEALELTGEQDLRVDIYALGVTLFELLTGVVPFEGRYPDVLVQVSTKSPPSILDARPDAPAALGSLVARCLARNPAARFHGMAELAQELRMVLRTMQDASPGPAGAPSAGDAKRTLPDTPVALRSTKPALGVTKRRFPRAPYTTPAELKLASGATLSGRVEEISEGGLQLITQVGVKSGERGEFRFAEPLVGKILKLTASSRWTKKARTERHVTGFEFDAVPDEARSSIRRYVELMGGS